MNESMTRSTRRAFLEKAVGLSGVMPFVPRMMLGGAPPNVAASVAGSPSADLLSNYHSLNSDEAAFIEQMVNVLCPADDLTPDGVTCGLALLVDRQLAGDYRTVAQRFAPVTWEHEDAESYSQRPRIQEHFFKAGIAAANTACQERFGVRFSQLAASEADRFLCEIAAGRVNDAEAPLASWLNQLVKPMLMQASFVEPVYDTHCNRVFWKLFGQARGYSST